MPAGSPDPGPVTDLPERLRDADLSGRDLAGADLSGRDLAGANLRGACLDGALLRDASLAGAVLVEASLQGAQLDHADLTRADLSRADLSGADLSGVTFDHTVLEGTTLTDAIARHAHWSTTAARGGDWQRLNLDGAVLEHVELVDLDLTGARLAGARLNDSDLSSVEFAGVEASGLQITDSTLADCTWQDANLTGGAVRFANLDRPVFLGTDLSDVAFESVAFKKGTFAVSSARGARLQRCGGLPLAVLDALAASGAEVALPLTVRLWRAVGSVPGLRPGLLALVVVGAAAGGVLVGQGLDGGEAGDEPPPEDGIETLAVGVDEATQEAWILLQRRYEEAPDQRPTVLLEQAKILESLESYDEAEERIRESVGLVQLHPEQRPELLPKLALGRFLLRRGEVDEAFELARAVISTAPTKHDTAWGFLLMAGARKAMDDPEGARAEAETLLQLLVTDDEVPQELRLQTALLLRDLGEDGKADALLRGFKEGREPLARAALTAADALAEAGDLEGAREAYDAILAEFADEPLIAEAARQSRARLARNARPTMGEMEAWTGSDDPVEVVRGELGLARLAIQDHRRDEAVRRFERVLAEHPEADGAVDAARELARLRWTSGDVDAAVEVLTAAINRAEADELKVTLREDLAGAYEADGRYAAARKVLLRTVSRSTDEQHVSRAKLHLAGIADREGDVDAALALYDEVATSEGSDAEMKAAARFGEGTMRRRIGSPAEALPLMDAALAELPEAHPLRGAIAVERAEVLVELNRGSVDELETMLGEARAASFDRAHPVAYGELLALLATALHGEGRFEDALAVFERLAASAASDEDAGLRQSAVDGRVAALVALGRTDAADELLDATGPGELSDGGAQAQCAAQASLARGRATTGDAEGAAQAWTSLLGECRDPALLVVELPLLADALVAAGQDDRARALLQGVVEAETAEVGRQAAWLELGRLGSVEDLDRAMSGPDPALGHLARVERAEQLAIAGRLAEAEPLWATVVDDAAAEPVPRSLALIGLGRLAGVRGQFDKSRGFLEEARLVAPEAWIGQQASALLGELDRMASEAP